MDNIEKLLKEIKEDTAIWSLGVGKEVRFSGKFLDSVGEIFEKHGFGTTKVFLTNQAGRDKMQAFSLVKVIDRFKKYPEIVSNRAIGRYIIKTLDTLKRMEA